MTLQKLGINTQFLGQSGSCSGSCPLENCCNPQKKIGSFEKRHNPLVARDAKPPVIRAGSLAHCGSLSFAGSVLSRGCLRLIARLLCRSSRTGLLFAPRNDG